jgi:hypothetical protein
MFIHFDDEQFFLAINVNIINIYVLCSCALRSSPCTHYFLVYAVFSIIYTCLVCPTQILRGFYIDWKSWLQITLLYFSCIPSSR